MKVIKKVLWFILIVLLISQFLGPDKNEGDITSIDAFLEETNPPEAVKIILKETCYDCHSNVTKYPWYNNITPVNYWLNHHVEEGKVELNFSNWVGNSVKRKNHKFEEIIEQVEEKEMPLKSYTWTHKEAKLTDKQITSLINWAKYVRLKYSLMAKPE